MTEPFDLDKWTEEFELSADTLKFMADKGFNSMKTIRKLNPDLIKKEFKGLCVAQSLMLQDGVDSLQPEAQKPARQPETIASVSVADNEPQDANACTPAKTQ